MSYNDLAQLTFNVSLGHKAHTLAQALFDAIPDKSKAGQAYWLYLGRSVAELYFITQGFKVKTVDFSQWNANIRNTSEIGCLEIEGCGRVQVIPCGSLAESVSLPREAQENILAYMIVDLDSEVEPLEELEEGTILGFIREFQAEVQLDALTDLDELPNYLSSLTQKQDWFLALIQRTREKASQLGNIVSESIDTITEQVRNSGTSGSVSLAGIQSQSSQCDSGEVPITIQLGHSTTQLTLDFCRVNETKVSIQANLIASGDNIFLPSNLTLAIKDAQGKTWDSICIGDREKIVTLERIAIDSTSYCTLELSLEQNLRIIKIE